MAEPIEYPTLLPKRMADVLETNGMVPDYVIMPGRFFLLPGARPDDRGVVLAGYYEYGIPGDPVIRGSLVTRQGEGREERVARHGTEGQSALPAEE